MAKKKGGMGKGFSLSSLGGGIPGGMKGGLAGQLQAMQQKMMDTQESLNEQTVEISVGGGAITVVMNGHQKLESIKINPEVVDPDDVDMLQDLIMAAINEAVEATQKLASSEIESITGNLGNIHGLSSLLG